MDTLSISRDFGLTLYDEKLTSVTPKWVEIPARPQAEFFLSFENELYGRVYMLVTVEQTDDRNWLATTSEIDSYGVGYSKTNALENFISELRAYYIELKDDEDILGPHLKAELKKLRKYFL